MQRKPPSDPILGHALGTNLFERIRAPRLKTALEQLLPDKLVEQRGNSTILMRCIAPGHADHHPSFYIYTALNYAVCKSCGFRTRSLLELLQVALGYSYSEIALKILELTGIRLVSERAAKILDQLDLHQMAIRYFGLTCNEHLQRLVRYFRIEQAPLGPDLELYTPVLQHMVKPVLEWLFDTRRLNPQFVPFLPYGVVPTSNVFEKLAQELIQFDWDQRIQLGVLPSRYSVERRQELVKKLLSMHKEVPAEYNSAVSFHTGYSQITPGRIRLRKVTRTQDTDNNFYDLPGFNPGDPVGYLGLYYPNAIGARFSDPESVRVKLVESEISMLAAQERVILDSVPDVLFIASAGSNNETDMLYQAGFTQVDLLVDHPDPAYGRGEGQIKIRLTTAFNLQAKVFIGWDELRKDVLTVKDPDDVIQYHGWAHFYDFVIRNQERWFVSADIWAADRAIEEGLQIPKHETLKRVAKTVEYGLCVRHPALLANFVAKVAAALELPPGPLRAAIVKMKDDEQGFIARIVETFRNEFVFLYKDDAKPGTIMLFHKERRRYIQLNITDGAVMLVTLSNLYGDMFAFFSEHIGLNSRFDDDSGGNALQIPIRDAQKYLADYLRIAFQTLYHGMLTKAECKLLGAGVHYEVDPENPAQVILRIHNGNRWFKVIVQRTTNELKAYELEGPIDGPYLFLPDVEPWSTVYTSVAAINAANQITTDHLKTTFSQLRDLLREGWVFRHQHEDVDFLASALFVFAASGIFDKKIILRLFGESNSGKSTLLSLFCKGQFPVIQLVESSGYSSQYTMASLYQQYDQSSLNMVLEEATQQAGVASHKSTQLEDINEMLRQVIYEGGAIVTRFGLGGKIIRYKVHTNAALTTVQEPRDVQDANRSYIVETVRQSNRTDPVVTILNKYSTAQLRTFTHSLHLGVLKYAIELREAQNDIYYYLNTHQLASYQAPTRFLRNFASIGAVLKITGADWVVLIRSMIESRKHRNIAQAASSFCGLVYDRLLRAPIIPVAGRNAYLSVMQCVLQANGHEIVNNAGVGLLVNPNNWTVIIDYVAATSPGGAFFKMPDLNVYTPTQLKAILDQHASVVRTAEYDSRGVMAALAANNLTARPHEISVVTIAELREEIVNHAKNYLGVAMQGSKDQKPRIVANNNL